MAAAAETLRTFAATLAPERSGPLLVAEPARDPLGRRLQLGSPCSGQSGSTERELLNRLDRLSINCPPPSKRWPGSDGPTQLRDDVSAVRHCSCSRSIGARRRVAKRTSMWCSTSDAGRG